MALGDKVLHFDKEGNRRATYTRYTRPKERGSEAGTIIIEQDRLIIRKLDPLGILRIRAAR